MGYLTTLTIYNDGIDMISKYAQQFADGVLDASREATMQHKPVDVRVGNFSNMVKVQRPRHADDPVVYVHMGNTVCELNSESEETENLMREHRVFFERMLKFMRDEVYHLSMKYKKIREEKEVA